MAHFMPPALSRATVDALALHVIPALVLSTATACSAHRKLINGLSGKIWALKARFARFERLLKGLIPIPVPTHPTNCLLRVTRTGRSLILQVGGSRSQQLRTVATIS